MKPLHVVGMHGMGDNFHQRAVLRELLKTRDEIWLETPWPCLYHDLPVLCVGKSSRLRTQAKNAAREADNYCPGFPPLDADRLEVWYPPASVRRAGSVLGAMSAEAGVQLGDFRMVVPDDWHRKAAALRLGTDPRPLMVVRPLVARTEWSGCAARNPDHAAYRALFDSIRKDFFVVSVADTVPGVEWIEQGLDADVRFEAGQLDVETLAALVSVAELVYASPGFAIPMAQAVGTPSVCVFGGYENGQSFTAGARFTPHLAIEPIRPCQCFSHNHACQKEIDMPLALSRLRAFVDEVVHVAV